MWAAVHRVRIIIIPAIHIILCYRLAHTPLLRTGILLLLPALETGGDLHGFCPVILSAAATPLLHPSKGYRTADPAQRRAAAQAPGIGWRPEKDLWLSAVISNHNSSGQLGDVAFGGR